ncbi:nitroreductase [Mycolicibacterium austroafricanum]|uniref:Nitroreductase n=1 Tax=Mycolicibacterium austroafricanum TaxID=39687 RepID=A0ABT8H6X5_MYCAO|nr:nitroreductase [Mycolicibacterium austroafricanum]MDN4516516.1 nitroreductase [Mycolicibacterium austroafricanum]PQP46341.1 nitroreductase [Mycolicibacterium austroafricanum]QRZ07166.1 nitroreductase [Mycolicibacterium austroafricanum]QZT63045.1 nitroreductase [Mycolicibacterium austroafricanum]QZT68651.1 nitroreductase [Mycolicibacterium austroafricanum]
MTTAFPDTAVLESVLDLAAHAPSVRNTQPWRWHVDQRGVQLFADWTRRLGDGDSDRRDVVLSCGAVLHHCAVALADAGWSSRIRRLPDDGALAAIELDRRPPGAGSRELADAIAHRRADRRPYAGSLPAGMIELLMLRAERFGVRLAVVPTMRWARIGDAEFALRYGDGSPGHPGDDAAMLVLATDTDTEVMRLRAGEALSDLTLAATALGLASCPLTEPLKDARDRLALACEVFDGEAYPQALIRLGQPAAGDPLPAVERRPVTETTTFDVN